MLSPDLGCTLHTMLPSCNALIATEYKHYSNKENTYSTHKKTFNLSKYLFSAKFSFAYFPACVNALVFKPQEIVGYKYFLCINAIVNMHLSIQTNYVLHNKRSSYTAPSDLLPLRVNSATL